MRYSNSKNSLRFSKHGNYFSKIKGAFLNQTEKIFCIDNSVAPNTLKYENIFQKSFYAKTNGTKN
jgi:uncharacterized Fe-S radical SAM superfamily protein PflX